MQDVTIMSCRAWVHCARVTIQNLHDVNMHWLISGKLLYNFALCYLASGNLWLSFWVTEGIQVTGGRDGKCFMYHKYNRNSPVYFWAPINSTFFRCVTKGFLRTGLFLRCVRAQDAPIPGVCFPDSDKWAFDWIHQQHGIWMKDDDEMDGGSLKEGGGGGGPLCGQVGCWVNKKRWRCRKPFRAEDRAAWFFSLLDLISSPSQDESVADYPLN